jgi:hypothetical protein
MRKLTLAGSVLLALAAFTAPPAQALPICFKWMPFCNVASVDDQSGIPSLRGSTTERASIQVNRPNTPSGERSADARYSARVDRPNSPSSQGSTTGGSSVQINRPNIPSSQGSTTGGSSLVINRGPVSPSVQHSTAGRFSLQTNRPNSPSSQKSAAGVSGSSFQLNPRNVRSSTERSTAVTGRSSVQMVQPNSH